MLRLYTDESPGLKVDPVVVLVLSLVFIFSVVALHSEFSFLLFLSLCYRGWLLLFFFFLALFKWVLANGLVCQLSPRLLVGSRARWVDEKEAWRGRGEVAGWAGLRYGTAQPLRAPGRHTTRGCGTDAKGVFRPFWGVGRVC